MKNRFILLLFGIILSIVSLNSQGFLKTEGKEIVDENGDPYTLKGMGLGGWMLQEGYMLQTAGFANAQHKIRERIEDLIGKEDTDQFYEAWWDHHVTEEDIDSLKSWGFNSVRLPMHYNLFTLPIEDEPIRGENTWLDRGFVMTDSLIDWCKDNEMYVILDLHAAPGGQGYDEGISDYDPNKPSLWESTENRAKTVALWRRLAERYKDEPWVAGYDLINEPNWNLPNNDLLKEIYIDITNAIRQVDQKHIIFIEGNWFANDFTNLTPPWDNNMVYSPHKYWSFNDKATIQWVLDIRERYDTPLYFGETGENSNVWFKDAISLFDEYNIGWAWWPMKKIESIAGPLTVLKTPEYQSLLDYWDGNGTRPSASFAKSTLMEITELLKIKNCVYQKDVIDAMFRQQESNESIAFIENNIPGIVYATDFDMGAVGSAYFDNEVANYQVSTGNFTSWNNGWSYRNDGIDIEKNGDNINSNGYNVGWIATDEWMNYTVNIIEDGVYNVNLRIAADSDAGKFHLESDGAVISAVESISNTGGWQSWRTATLENIVLTTSDDKIKFYVDNDGFNFSSMEFIRVQAIEEVATSFLSAFIEDGENIYISINKPLIKSDINLSDFSVLVNNVPVSITSVEHAESNRLIEVSLNESLSAQDRIIVSYDGTNIQSIDQLALSTFANRSVENRIPFIHFLPTKIEAEDYISQVGFQLENTTDQGGGQNIGFLDVGDYADYQINVPTRGVYNVEYRTASENSVGGVELSLVDQGETLLVLHDVTFPSTGGWQNWRSTDARVKLPEGQHTLRMTITEPLFNMNWMDFSLISSTATPEIVNDISIYPNPVSALLNLDIPLKNKRDIDLSISDPLGRTAYRKLIKNTSHIQNQIDLSSLTSGQYTLNIKFDTGEVYSHKFQILR